MRRFGEKNLSNNRDFETFYMNGNRFGMEMLAPKTKMGSHFLASVLYRLCQRRISRANLKNENGVLPKVGSNRTLNLWNFGVI